MCARCSRRRPSGVHRQPLLVWRNIFSRMDTNEIIKCSLSSERDLLSCPASKTKWGEKQKRRVCCSKTIPKVSNKIRRAAMKKVLLLLRIQICRAPVYESARVCVCTSSLSLSRLCYQWFCASLIFVLVFFRRTHKNATNQTISL